MRKIRFDLTPDRILDKTKTVTRRKDWKNLKPGAELIAVNKKKGSGKTIDLARIRVIGVHREPLDAITEEDVRKEGFPDWTTGEFISFCEKNLEMRAKDTITRIEFEYMTFETIRT
uniref:ASCH domain-containing protein n=1 Tax=Candidatus Kentrum sp. TC TaxID=2126339 RepID=A0A450YYM8_9GAMM|nr:MAG: hypothetical protein BECKTC1821E_GA0114239_106722 [Candidatus Kentron sp. TC]